MSEKRFHKDMLNIVDVLTNRAYTFEFEEDLDEMLDLLNELFEHNLHLQRLIESLAKCTGEPIEDTIKRYEEKKEIYTTSKRPMRFVGGRKI